jgi:hypothetical protein
MLKGGKWKGRRTDVVSGVCTVLVDELGIYVVPINRFVVQKPVLSLPSGKVVQALDDNYVGTVVLFVGGLVYAVDTAVEVFGKIA